MGLLDIAKGKKGQEQPKVDVPDELPSLPGKSSAQQPAQQTPQTSSQLAPNEIPPLKPAPPVSSTQAVQKTPQQANALIAQTQQPSQESAPQPVHGERLYFMELIKRFSTKETREQAEQDLLASSTSEVLESMHTQWESHKQQQQLQQYEQMIAAHVEPLQQLEQEWRALHDEIDKKKLLLQEKEFAIQQNTAELKRLVDAKNRLKEQMERFGR